MSNDKYQNLTDEALVFLARTDDSAAIAELICRIVPIIKARVHKYEGNGFEHEDLMQEGMLAFLNALYGYEETKPASFRTYVASCVEHKLHSSLRNAGRKKRIPAKHLVSLDDETFGSTPSMEQGPEDFLIDQEEVTRLTVLLNRHLSKFENNVLRLRLTGMSYSQISHCLNETPKAVDNALQRVRSKLKKSVSPAP